MAKIWEQVNQRALIEYGQNMGASKPKAKREYSQNMGASKPKSINRKQPKSESK